MRVDTLFDSPLGGVDYDPGISVVNKNFSQSKVKPDAVDVLVNLNLGNDVDQLFFSFRFKIIN